MERAQTEQILQQALSYQQADHLQVSLHGEVDANTRFANNTITQNTAQKDAALGVTAAFGQQVGHANTNRLDRDSLREVVQRAEQIAQSTAPDTEYLPPVGPQSYLDIDAYDHATAEVTPQARAEMIQKAIQKCEVQGLDLAGHFSTGWRFSAIANSNAVMAYHRQSSASYTNTVMSPTSSGWAEVVSERLEQIQPLEAVDIACQKAKTSQSPRDIEPGQYTVILEPSAVSGVLGPLFYSLEAKAADEGRSAFSNKEGEQIGTSAVDLYSQPDHTGCPTRPFFGNGLPTDQVYWLKSGKLENLSYSRYWASRTGHAHTGSPTNMVMSGDDNTLQQMIASVEQGLLVTRFWYIRFVDPMKLLMTGMTRDGLFWIENGQICYGVKNLRFNESPLHVLANIEMMGQPCRTGGSAYVPPLKVQNFTFSSGTSF